MGIIGREIKGSLSVQKVATLRFQLDVAALPDLDFWTLVTSNALATINFPCEPYG
jgi:hypothetical protein